MAHLVLLWITFFIGAFGYCPLTVVENSLRMNYDPTSIYAEGFIERHLDRLAAWDVEPTRVLLVVMAWTLFWTAVYVFLWIRVKNTR